MNKLIQSGDSPLLTEERKKSTFDTDTLASIFYGSKQAVHRRRELYQYYLKNKELHDPEPVEFMDRYHKLENAQRKVAVLKKHLAVAVPDQNSTDMHTFIK